MGERQLTDIFVMGKLALAFILIVSVIPAGATARSHDERAPAALSLQATEVPALQTEVLTVINQLRQGKGLGRLRLSGPLSNAAVGHSLSMAKHGFFGHEGYGGSAFWQRIKPRYPPGPRGYWSVGENLLWSSPSLTAQQALDMWLDSPPHRKNLLSPVWHDVGIGAVHTPAAPGVYEGREVTILTADFGVR